MRITAKRLFGQLTLFVLLVFFTSLNFSSCKANKEEQPVIPPVTSPLTRDFIGFGVITASFTHLNEDPVEDSRSLGYLRKGSLVRIIRRQIIKTNDEYISWVLTDGKQNEIETDKTLEPSGGQIPIQGWLKESEIEIYVNEQQAMTASEAMAK